MHKAKKRFGQNFLHDQNVILKIIASMGIKAPATLVEIGPGQGALTEHLLAKNNGKLEAIELDRDLYPILRAKFFDAPEFVIHECDALEFDFGSLYQGDKMKVAGNLPYNVSTPLLFHLLTFADKIQDMTFMLQKEVVDRICAGPGENNYGRLSVMIQYHCKAEYLFTVPPGCFTPAPKVDSAILRLTPKVREQQANNLKTLEDLVRQSFSQRRKTLRNNLKKTVSDAQFEAAGIDPSLRPERISVEQYVTLANLL